MADKMRWRHGATNPVVAAVDSATVIELGDLLWQDTDDAEPASSLNPYVFMAHDEPRAESRKYQKKFAERFLGVAMQHSRNGDTTPVRVGTTGVFKFNCPSGTFELGGLIGVRYLDIPLGPESELQDRPIHRLANQEVVGVSDCKYAIGRVAKFEHRPVTSVLIDIRSRVMGHGVE